ncbi:restriction endonuclease [Vibrio lentus]|uniref:restriction endonuclease n=1 Tax=Vibrio TaxID=662 RepID=UPI000C820A5F|nr:restriction endonuclease [Vibrio lentus]MCC4815019.1 restriction endonuclease [Vibrio lentus]PMG74669.1 restriction endonuclease [Vibrio lentus]PMK88598.1 restriction endonuclease [Vibrio lentus]PML26701.1 restriction endonuclease [Vibrio lentus]PMM28826.1 restriction endonuclease [Vibrio lentus]
MSTGKDYEIFVQNLQQALINSEELMLQKNIEIERNKKITDNYGIVREFDLYWEYELAGVTYKTIIECKDYTSRVSIDRIDGLIGKIRDIPDLKPVFATKTGYQSGAELKAKNNKIDLLIVREQRDDDWEDKEGNPLIREVNINMQIMPSAQITNFKPFLDGDWLKENTDLNIDSQLVSSGLNNEIFIEDIERGEKYSLLELSTKLEKISREPGEHSYSEMFKDAYLINNGLKLKICKYEVDYWISEPINQPIKMDFSKELVGVIEYLHKDSITAVFKDKIVKDWR